MRKLLVLFLLPIFLMATQDTLDWTIDYSKDGFCYCIGKDSVALTDAAGDTLYILGIRIGQFNTGLLTLYDYVDSMVVHRRWAPIKDRLTSDEWDSLTATAATDTIFEYEIMDTIYHSMMDLRIISTNTDTLNHFGWYIDLGRD